MTLKQKIASVLAALAVVFVGVQKVLNGEAPDVQEVILALGVIAAALGFQKNG